MYLLKCILNNPLIQIVFLCNYSGMTFKNMFKNYVSTVPLYIYKMGLPYDFGIVG